MSDSTNFSDECGCNIDYNSILIFKCDGCHLIKPNLRVFADKKEKGYLCEYCFTQ